MELYKVVGTELLRQGTRVVSAFSIEESDKTYSQLNIMIPQDVKHVEIYYKCYGIGNNKPPLSFTIKDDEYKEFYDAFTYLAQSVNFEEDASCFLKSDVGNDILSMKQFLQSWKLQLIGAKLNKKNGVWLYSTSDNGVNGIRQDRLLKFRNDVIHSADTDYYQTSDAFFRELRKEKKEQGRH